MLYQVHFLRPITCGDSCFGENWSVKQRAFWKPPQPLEKATESVWQRFSRLLGRIAKWVVQLNTVGVLDTGVLQSRGATDQRLSGHAKVPYLLVVAS